MRTPSLSLGLAYPVVPPPGSSSPGSPPDAPSLSPHSLRACRFLTNCTLVIGTVASIGMAVVSPDPKAWVLCVTNVVKVTFHFFISPILEPVVGKKITAKIQSAATAEAVDATS